MPIVMANLLSLKIEPSSNSFIFVDCSEKNLEGIVRDFHVNTFLAKSLAK